MGRRWVPVLVEVCKCLYLGMLTISCDLCRLTDNVGSAVRRRRLICG